jgi:hypothetical protein
MTCKRAVAQEFKMAFFHLVPRNNDTSDPCWATSILKEGCWIEADSEEKARGALAIKTETLDPPNIVAKSPWLDDRLTECLQAEPPFDFLVGKILSDSGRMFDA